MDNSIVDDYHLNFSYGRANYIAGKFETAKKYLLKNFREKRNDAAVNYMLGVCYLESGAVQEAKKYPRINSRMKDKAQAEYINYSIRTLRNILKP